MGAYRLTDDSTTVIRTADNAVIPENNNSVDWQAYVAWLAKGNVPDPYVAPTPSVPAQFADKLAEGVQATWTISTNLNASYAVDPTTQLNIIAETLSIVVNNAFGDGGNTRPWPTLSGQQMTFNIAQFKAFATAVQFYVNQLYATFNAMMLGENVSWPSSSISVNG